MQTPQRNTRFTKITVTFEARPGGGLRAYSDDVPGFILSHWDAAAVLADVQPALETILSAMWGIAVAASPLATIKRGEDDNGSALDIPDPYICPKEYVAYAE